MDYPDVHHHPFDSLEFPLQNLQQSRGFGNNFKFPEGTDPTTGAPASATTAGNSGFTEEAEDDLYA
jgi:transitional endoplasmic reticulum ATPase